MAIAVQAPARPPVDQPHRRTTDRLGRPMLIGAAIARVQEHALMQVRVQAPARPPTDQPHRRPTDPLRRPVLIAVVTRIQAHTLRIGVQALLRRRMGQDGRLRTRGGGGGHRQNRGDDDQAPRCAQRQS